jgi:glycosyltransferase involved in cell wall biosynthesis
MQGGLSSGRNLNTLIESMKYVQNKEIILVILGEGYLLKDLQKLTEIHNLTNTVYFHEAVAQSELMHLTASADAGIIPYQPICLNNFYCTPNKLFEFIAAGLPIIATDLPEIKKIVQGSEIGLVGDTSSSLGFAKLIDDFFSNTELLIKMKSNLLLAQKLYCWEMEGMKLVEIYKGLR